jgi:hypothetical protein
MELEMDRAEMEIFGVPYNLSSGSRPEERQSETPDALA